MHDPFAAKPFKYKISLGLNVAAPLASRLTGILLLKRGTLIVIPVTDDRLLERDNGGWNPKRAEGEELES